MILADYEQFLAGLFTSRRRGVTLGLERVERGLAALGHPERACGLRIQIGGTNGKGSTAAFVDAIARQAGRRTGLFTSPHLSQFAERFQIAGKPAARSEILRAHVRVAGLGIPDLTFFEQVTLIGLVLFADAGVEVAIIEVGMGGEHDATTAARAEIAAVTGVALDHQEYLGATLDHIADAKAGIFRPGQRAVIGCAGERSAVPRLIAGARRADVAELTVIDLERDAPDGPLGLAGAHQRANAACALAIVDHARAMGALDADDACVARGLKYARLPGRFETLATAPHIVIDGAHNPDAARVLADAMRDLPEPRALVLGISRDKDVRNLIAPLIDAAAMVVSTEFFGDRAMSAHDIHAVVRQLAPHSLRVCEPDPHVALSRAIAQVGPGGAVVVTGSLFIVGYVRQLICGDRADPISLTDPVGVARRT